MHLKIISCGSRCPSRAAAHLCYERFCPDPTPPRGFFSGRVQYGSPCQAGHPGRQCWSLLTAFRPGDEVYGFGHGAFAEYIAVSQGSLAPKPGNLTFEQAAATPLAAVTALQCLRAGGIGPGQHVVIIGASGGVGSFAVQLARHLGAQVTGVCSTPHLDLVRRLGAEQVIDYTSQDFTTGAARYDLALQLGGTYSPAAIRKVLTPRGTLVQSFGDGGRWLGPAGNIIKALVLNALAGQTLKSCTAKITAQALREVGDLIESGHITPVIDRTYPLADAAAAVALVEQGTPEGKVIVVVDPPGVSGA